MSVITWEGIFVTAVLASFLVRRRGGRNSWISWMDYTLHHRTLRSIHLHSLKRSSIEKREAVLLLRRKHPLEEEDGTLNPWMMSGWKSPKELFFPLVVEKSKKCEIVITAKGNKFDYRKYTSHESHDHFALFLWTETKRRETKLAFPDKWPYFIMAMMKLLLVDFVVNIDYYCLFEVLLCMLQEKLQQKFQGRHFLAA